MAAGTGLFLATVDALTDDELLGDSALTGWTRRHLLAHLAFNAEGLARLTSWARTGVETPMYTSPEQRAQEIEAGSRQSPAELRAKLRRTADLLTDEFASLSETAWAATVRTATGRTVPAGELPWIRSREVFIHSVDLGTGLRFAELPADFCTALVGDVTTRLAGLGTAPALRLTATGTGATWSVPGHGEPVPVTLPVAELAAWLTGRQTRDDLPALPPWL